MSARTSAFGGKADSRAHLEFLSLMTDFVAKLDEERLARNIRLEAREFLNQHCALARSVLNQYCVPDRSA
jgi:hypothetical protein